MSQPTVCAVMLVNGRPEMVKRAVASFRAQTYEAKHILVWDSGEEYLPVQVSPREGWHKEVSDDPQTIGMLRNSANSWVSMNGPAHQVPDIFIHWDSDDWSHPRRIEEQVALLQASGKECVGYREALFWQEPKLIDPALQDMDCYEQGQAWLYTNNDPRYCIGASLCYWRAAWERRPFPDLPKPGSTENGAEDNVWLREIDSVGVAGFRPALWGLGQEHEDGPRLLCSIHGGNSQHYDPDGCVADGSKNWRRVPEWDTHCCERMTL